MRRLLFSLKLIFLFYTIFLSCHLEKQKSQEEEKKCLYPFQGHCLWLHVNSCISKRKKKVATFSTLPMCFLLWIVWTTGVLLFISRRASMATLPMWAGQNLTCYFIAELLYKSQSLQWGFSVQFSKGPWETKQAKNHAGPWYMCVHYVYGSFIVGQTD